MVIIGLGVRLGIKRGWGWIRWGGEGGGNGGGWLQGGGEDVWL